jgi:hypothetical protein
MQLVERASPSSSSSAGVTTELFDAGRQQRAEGPNYLKSNLLLILTSALEKY